MGLKNEHILIHSDNNGAIGAHSKHRSRSVPINLSVRHTYSILTECIIIPSFTYIESALNPADLISRGESGSPSDHCSLVILTFQSNCKLSSYQMDEPPTNMASCEVVDLGFGVFIARTPPPCKPLPENLTPIAPSNQTPPVTRLSPYVSIISTLNPPLTTSPSPNMPINDTLSNVRSKAASSLRACKPRQPLPQNDWNHSPLCPLVPADRQVLLWTTLHSLCAQASLDNEISPRLKEKVFTNFTPSHFT